MQDEKPFVSVVVTTFNRKELLKETIESILCQTYTNFELIVIDNFSNYDFFLHMDSFGDDRIIPFQNNNDGIIAVNRNFGIKKAVGEYIAFCDDDDLWVPQKLEEQLNHFDERIIGVGSEMILISEKNVEIENKPKQRIQEDLLLDFKKMIMDRSVPLSSLIVKNIGFLFDESPSFLAAEDFDFQLNLTLQTRKCIKSLSTPLIYYRVNSLNKNSGFQQNFNSFRVLEKYDRYMSKQTKNIFHAKMYYKIGKQRLALKMAGESRKYFMKSIQTGTFDTKMLKSVLCFFVSFFPPNLQAFFLKRTFN